MSQHEVSYFEDCITFPEEQNFPIKIISEKDLREVPTAIVFPIKPESRLSSFRNFTGRLTEGVK